MFTFGNAQHKSVGELPSHGHSGNTNDVNINGGFRLDGTEDCGTTSGWGVFSVGPTFAPNKGHGDHWGGSNAGRNIYFNTTHSHTVTISNTGSSQSHNIMQPYLAIYIWRRIA